MTAPKPPPRSPFSFPSPDVRLASAEVKKKAKRGGAHIIGRPLTNYLSLKAGSAAVDPIAVRLADGDVLEKNALILKLRSAVLTAHTAGTRKIAAVIDHGPARVAASLRALRALSALVYDPSFIPAVQQAASFVAAEHPSYADRARELEQALNHVPLLEAVLKDAQRGLTPVERQNPGRPYMVGLAESFVSFWHQQTGTLPSKTRKAAMRSKSHRILFWDFLDRALVDLSLKDQPIDYHVRSAIDRLQKGERPPHK